MTRKAAALRRFVRSHLLLTEAFNALRRAFVGPPSSGSIAMFHIGRCGSTVLAKMLEQNPAVRWGHELFQNIHRTAPGFEPSERWVRATIRFSLYQERCRWFGFETKQAHFGPRGIPMEAQAYVGLLESLGFRHYILLRRRNYLRVVISAVVGKRVGKYHVASGPAGPNPIRLDPQLPWGTWAGSLVEIFDFFDRFYADLAEVLRDRQSLSLEYEDDIEADPLVAYRKVCAFLKIEPGDPAIPLARTNPYPIAQMLSNFEEVAGALAGTRHEWMLGA